MNPTATAFATLQHLGLLTAREGAAVAALAAAGSRFAGVVAEAETVHLHIKVDDTHDLPINAFFAAGAQLDHQKDGFVKFRFPGGLNAIFSHIKVAQDELAETAATRRPRPFLDHIGVDLRDEARPAVRAAFDTLPGIGRDLGWAHAGQGGAGKPVMCCHVEVAEKHWLYPDRDGVHAGIPIEFAYGALKVTPGRSGCDLRPADPRLNLAVECGATACGDAANGPERDAGAARPGGYYQPADLTRFAQITRVNPQVGNAFFAYYGMVMGDGVLSKREKALAALAVAHAQKCPYCIDAYTATLHGLGATEEEMSEIVHVAAAMLAGISLVHSVQMMNRLDALRGCDPATGCC